MAYRLHKETPQLRKKIEYSTDKLTSHWRQLGRHSVTEWLTTPSNNTQVLTLGSTLTFPQARQKIIRYGK